MIEAKYPFNLYEKRALYDKAATYAQRASDLREQYFKSKSLKNMEKLDEAIKKNGKIAMDLIHLANDNVIVDEVENQ